MVTEVASYGKQLGWLTEIAIALARTQPVPAETLVRLEKAANDIAAQSKSRLASPPSRPRMTHSIAWNATTLLNIVTCCASGEAPDR